ncbi:cytochrome b [Loktanella sp. Alg231-35]|uniref:cytochrome b n=1 Tax=Loktanella sp. Alg231-35 TaxID=1922220 RepID=UPI000D55943E|nr:cytochrome b/b6 domain-containing protein [Loktanella sp. Alg231-35]
MTISAQSPVKPHGFVTRSIHWVSILMIAYGYYKGLDNVNQLADPALFRFEVIFASSLGLLFAFRLFWTQKIGGATRLPHKAPAWEHVASRTVHYGLYGSVFTIVGTGLAIAYAYASPVLGDFFVNAMIFIHEAALTLLPALILTHITGALWHKVIRRDGVLEAMTGKLPI